MRVILDRLEDMRSAAHNLLQDIEAVHRSVADLGGIQEAVPGLPGRPVAIMEKAGWIHERLAAGAGG